jgi:hypothetical protein
LGGQLGVTSRRLIRGQGYFLLNAAAVECHRYPPPSRRIAPPLTMLVLPLPAPERPDDSRSPLG